MAYHTFATLKEFHVEITNRCNAACPMCSRNNFGGADVDNLSPSEWGVADAERVFDPQFTSLRNILFCGTHGDPASAKECLNIIEVIRRRELPATIEFYSNGGARNPDWWRELAKLLSFTKTQDSHYRKNDIAVFSIDGLKDTNHLYRRKTNFEKIIENAKAFIEAGGKARWDFLVFKHNEHQVEEAEKLAKQLGFKGFRLRKTSRFAYSPDGPQRFRVQNTKGEIEYYLEPPTQQSFQNTQAHIFQDVVNKEKTGAAIPVKKIQCLYRDTFGRMYVNSQMKVFPCCFVSSDVIQASGRAYSDFVQKVEIKYGSEFNSLRNFSWNEILNHEWLSNEMVESWSKPQESLLRCQKTCGLGHNPILSQSQDTQL